MTVAVAAAVGWRGGGAPLPWTRAARGVRVAARDIPNRSKASIAGRASKLRGEDKAGPARQRQLAMQGSYSVPPSWPNRRGRAWRLNQRGTAGGRACSWGCLAVKAPAMSTMASAALAGAAAVAAANAGAGAIATSLDADKP